MNHSKSALNRILMVALIASVALGGAFAFVQTKPAHAQAEWCRSWDFTSAPSTSWSAETNLGIWVSGSGWESQAYAGAYSLLYLDLNLTSQPLQYSQIWFTVDVTPASDVVSQLQWWNGTTPVAIVTGADEGSHYFYRNDNAAPYADRVQARIAEDGNTNNLGRITSAQVEGYGTPPSDGYDCFTTPTPIPTASLTPSVTPTGTQTGTPTSIPPTSAAPAPTCQMYNFSNGEQGWSAYNGNTIFDGQYGAFFQQGGASEDLRVISPSFPSGTQINSITTDFIGTDQDSGVNDPQLVIESMTGTPLFVIQSGDAEGSVVGFTHFWPSVFVNTGGTSFSGNQFVIRHSADYNATQSGHTQVKSNTGLDQVIICFTPTATPGEQTSTPTPTLVPDQSCPTMTNPTFANDSEGWLDPSHYVNSYGSNPPGSSIGYLYGGPSQQTDLQQTMPVTPATNYLITLMYHLSNPMLYQGGQTLRISVGSHNEDIPISNAGQTQSFTSAAFQPDTGLVDILAPSSSQSGLTAGGLVLDFLCIAPQSGNQPRGTCILANPTFSGGDDPWTTTGDFGDGFVELHASSSDYVQQQIMLYPKQSGAQGYSVAIQFSSMPPGNLAVHLTASFGSWSDATISTDNPKTQTVTKSFVVSTTTTDNFKIAIQEASLGIAQITSVCITTTDGTTPGGYFPPPWIQPTCQNCIYNPTGDFSTDVVALIRWLDCRIQQLWYCQARSIFFGIWQVLVSILMFLGMMRIWMGADAAIFASWLNGALLNLGTRVANAVMYGQGQTYIINNTSTSFWDVLIALFNQIGSVLTSAVNAIVSVINDFKDVILSLINAILAIIFALFALLMSLLSIFANLLTALIGVLSIVPRLISDVIGGFNATATQPGNTGGGALFWSLSCSDNTDALYYPCLGLYVLDNTIFTGPLGMIFPIAYAALGLSEIMWAVRKYSKALG